jgi:IclR family transcriptional regulator, pca regulon regulatory protein
MIRSLSRGVEILGCFTPQAPRMRLKEIADRLGLPMGSAFRTIRTLEAHGYVIQDPVSKLYRLGLRVLDLGQACLSGMEFPDVALPFLEALASDTRQSANMSVLDSGEIVFVARASVVRLMRDNLSVGSRLPSHCTAMGKVLLAGLDAGDAERVVGALELRGFTPNTITDRAALTAALVPVRQLGYAISREELQLHLTAVAAPVRGPTGSVVAAINVAMYTGPGDDDSDVMNVLPKLVRTAATISSALGFRPGRSPD